MNIIALVINDSEINIKYFPISSIEKILVKYFINISCRTTDMTFNIIILLVKLILIFRNKPVFDS